MASDTQKILFRHQIAHSDRHNTKSGDRLIDEYFYHFMLDSSLNSNNVSELRKLARKMVDSQQTDNKKRMLVLRQQNMSNKQIGISLGKPLSNQAVSKAIKSIREE